MTYHRRGRKGMEAGKAPAVLPEPGGEKSDPKELDRMLDIALEDSMATSDPPEIVIPDVRK